MPRKGAKKTETAPIATPDTREQFIARYDRYGDEHRPRRFMIFTVLTFAIVIVGLWGYALSYQIANINWNKSVKNGIVGNTQTKWNEAFTDMQKKEDLKKQITQLISALAVSSATGTITNAATGTIDASSTALTATNTIFNTTTNHQ